MFPIPRGRPLKVTPVRAEARTVSQPVVHSNTRRSPRSCDFASPGVGDLVDVSTWPDWGCGACRGGNAAGSGVSPVADSSRAMARFVFGLLVVIVAFAQATILPALVPMDVLPDVTLVLLLLWSALRGVPEGALWVFGVGLLLDLLALDRLGTNGLALLVVALMAGLARRRFFHSGLVFPIVLALAATIGHALVLLLLRGIANVGPIGINQGVILLHALLNALLVPPLYPVAARMDRWLLEAKA